MKKRISRKQRQQVAERAEERCEYCLVPEFVGFAAYECDHIISEKQGGATQLDNLAYSCQFCNRAKGTNISSFQGKPPELLPLFNPRTDSWTDHFRYTADGRIHGKTPIGVGTIFVLNMNEKLWCERRATFFENRVMSLLE